MHSHDTQEGSPRCSGHEPTSEKPCPVIIELRNRHSLGGFLAVGSGLSHFASLPQFFYKRALCLLGVLEGQSEPVREKAGSGAYCWKHYGSISCHYCYHLPFQPPTPMPSRLTQAPHSNRKCHFDACNIHTEGYPLTVSQASPPAASRWVLVQTLRTFRAIKIH